MNRRDEGWNRATASALRSERTLVPAVPREIDRRCDMSCD